MYVPYNANTSRYTIAVDVASAVINPITLFNTTATTRAMKYLSVTLLTRIKLYALVQH